MILLLSVICSAVILLHCAALTQIMTADALPPGVKALWLGAVVLFPVVAAVLWFRLPAAAKIDSLASRPGRGTAETRRAVTITWSDE